MVWTIGEIVQAAFKQSLAADLAPVDLRARYMGVFSLCIATAITIGTPVCTHVLAQYGQIALWSFCGALALLSSGLFGILRYRLNRADQAGFLQKSTA